MKLYELKAVMMTGVKTAAEAGKFWNERKKRLERTAKLLKELRGNSRQTV